MYFKFPLESCRRLSSSDIPGYKYSTASGQPYTEGLVTPVVVGSGHLLHMFVRGRSQATPRGGGNGSGPSGSVTLGPVDHQQDLEVHAVHYTGSQWSSFGTSVIQRRF